MRKAVLKIKIQYCLVCNYLPIAARLAIDIKNEFACEVEYEPGPAGVFNVYRDGKLLFSKSDSGDRFPEKGEIISLLKRAAPDSAMEKSS